MASPTEIARQRQLEQQALARTAARVAAEAWAGVDPGNIAASWGSLLARPYAATAAAQLIAAQGADGYVDEVLAAGGEDFAASGRVNPRAFAGVASDGRPLESLLYNPVIQTLEAIGKGIGVQDALTLGLTSLDMIVRTQVADAGRAATGVGLASRGAGYTRQLSGKSCSRCVVLAGKWYHWNAGFQRHPRCDCVHVPCSEGASKGLKASPRGYFDSLSAKDQDRAFTRAGAQAIRDGADIGQVVNARRGMQSAGGRLTTTEGTTRRGFAGQQLGRKPRLMPEQIYKDARDREEALRLLRENGYLAGNARSVAPLRAPSAPSFDTRFRAAASNERALSATPAGLPRQSGAPTLTRQQRAALRDYESSYYAAINGQLRRVEVGTLVGRRVERIDQVMALSRTSVEIAVWRGVTNAGRLFGGRLNRNLTGFTWTERAYGSTTADRRIATSFTYPGADDTPKVLMRILVPRGTGAARISGMGSGLGGGPQAEVLLQRGLRMRVVADRGMSPDGHRLIDVEVVAP